MFAYTCNADNQRQYTPQNTTKKAWPTMNTESLNPASITPHEALKVRENALFLDVRTPAEFAELHIEGSVLHPLHELDEQRVRELLVDRSAAVVVCRSGGRAKEACKKLIAHGISNVHVLDGGVTAWSGSGLPVVRGKKTISLERQVRIGAGSLVLLGALLGYFISPAFIALSAFVGAGLIFAGVTDTCGMAMMLARMPWNNQCRGATTCSVQSK